MTTQLQLVVVVVVVVVVIIIIIIIIIIGATGNISKSLRQYLSNMQERTKLRTCKKQPYWALHTYCRKC